MCIEGLTSRITQTVVFSSKNKNWPHCVIHQMDPIEISVYQNLNCTNVMPTKVPYYFMVQEPHNYTAAHTALVSELCTDVNYWTEAEFWHSFKVTSFITVEIMTATFCQTVDGSPK